MAAIFVIMSSAEPNQPNDSNTVNDTANSAVNCNEKQIKFTSPMWRHFTYEEVNGTKKAVCKYYRQEIAYTTKNGTKGMHSHHKSCKIRIGQKKIDDFQSQLTGKRSKTDESGGSILATHRFNYDESRTDLAKMITKHDYPLRIVEHEGFRDFCQGLQPLFRPIYRNTTRSDVMKLYGEEKARMMHFLESIQGRIAITTDMWTANYQKKGYMTVTAHFIDDYWQLQSRLLSLLDWNIDKKLSTLTVDNCSTNNCMIDLMVDKLPFDSLILGRSLFHMRCVAHILNLIVRSGLDVFGHGIEKVRNSCSFWTATPKRHDIYISKKCKVREFVDCKTRWNSTYLMLSTALKYKKNVPDEKEWALASELCDRLKIFYNVTELFSGTKYPTTNIFFPKICEIKIALKKWDTSSFIEISEMSENMITKFDEHWKESHGVLAMATILDPRFKMNLLEYFFPIIYGVDNAKDEIQKVRQICEDIYLRYESRVMSQTSTDDITNKPTSSRDAALTSDMDSLDAFFSWNSATSEVFVKNELERYLEEVTLPRIHEFDLLGWWKLNGVKYPTLCLIAKDILVIPISTVASESSFSTSGRIVSPHRSRLLPSTIEAIICTQNWLWAGCVIDGDDVHSDEDGEGLEDIRMSVNEELKEINGY
uniref:BED-type domain-containing protein n=1 Tax=Lactuca sativa TaxID=4236 RepID=A0A9R1V5C3_LACSA|nr:hypothetical protein LSAT_V11C600314420 [Lactuca sativa]